MKEIQSNQMWKNQTDYSWNHRAFSERAQLALPCWLFHTDVSIVYVGLLEKHLAFTWRVGSWIKSVFLISTVNWKFACCAWSLFGLSSIIWVQQSFTYLFLIRHLIPVLLLRWSNIPSTINKVSSLLSKHEEVSVVSAEGHEFSDGQL